MRHAAHQAANNSRQYIRTSRSLFSSHQAANNSRQYIRTSRSLFSSGSGAHSAKAVRMAQMTQSNGAVLGLDQAVVERLNEAGSGGCRASQRGGSPDPPRTA